eukprot:TRINITY_DN4175_c0_g2_i1.p1 TRINITY_DN4175_c0_g2~~TRINITY_DN4175_c0_g2_i1.p1  ORF type:complete len:150 (-),score=43.71 TRINITY_DN4175_c0_g2_i1:478-927(-)
MSGEGNSKDNCLILPKEECPSPTNQSEDMDTSISPSEDGSVDTPVPDKQTKKKMRNRKHAQKHKEQIKRNEEELTKQHGIVKEKWESTQRLFKLIKKIEDIKGKAYTENLKVEALEYARNQELKRSQEQQNGEEEEEGAAADSTPERML